MAHPEWSSRRGERAGAGEGLLPWRHRPLPAVG